MEEHHDLPDHLLFGPGINNSLLPLGTNAIEVCEAVRRLLNDVKDCFPESLDQFLGKVWTNPFDHPGAEILFDAFERTGWHDAKMLCLELETMGPISHPPTLPLNILTWGNGRCSTYHSHEITMPTDFDP
jgi:hypothetical protein